MKKVEKLLKSLNEFIQKAEDDKPTLEAFLMYLTNNLFAEDEFADEFGEVTAEFLQLTVEELAKLIKESIVKDIQFEVLSKRTTDWIQRCSRDLAELG